MFPILLQLTLALAGPGESEPARTMQPVLDAIELEAGASCLDRTRIAGKVVSWLGEHEVDARIEVLILGDMDDPTRVVFALRKQDKLAAEREFDFEESTSCDEKHAVVSVAVALAIDATLVEEVEPDVEPIPVRPPIVSNRPRRTKPEAPDEPRPTSDWSVRLGLGAGVSVNTPPPLGGHGVVTAEFGWKDYVDLSLGALYSASSSLETGPGRAVPSVVGGQGLVCGGYRFGRVRPRGCAGLVLGAALANGQGFADDRTSRVPWLAVTPGIDLRVRVADRVELELGGDLVVHAIRPAFDYLDEGGQRTLGEEFPILGGFVGLGVIITLR